MTSGGEIDIHPVTNDPELMKTLIRHWQEADADQVTEQYAYSLGLYPPGYVKGEEYELSLLFPPGADEDGGLLIWNTSRVGDDGDCAEDDDAEPVPDSQAEAMPPSRPEGCTEPPPF